MAPIPPCNIASHELLEAMIRRPPGDLVGSTHLVRMLQRATQACVHTKLDNAYDEVKERMPQETLYRILCNVETPKDTAIANHAVGWNYEEIKVAAREQLYPQPRVPHYLRENPAVANAGILGVMLGYGIRYLIK